MILSEEDALHEQLKRAAEWGENQGVPMHLGEFGVYDHPPTPVDRVSREAWIRSMRQAAEANQVAWSFFELSSEFGLYNHQNAAWNQDMLSALTEDE